MGHFGSPRSRRQALRLAVGGRAVLGDLDDLPARPDGWDRASASHNTVLVDGLNQRETLPLMREPAAGRRLPLLRGRPRLPGRRPRRPPRLPPDRRPATARRSWPAPGRRRAMRSRSSRSRAGSSTTRSSTPRPARPPDGPSRSRRPPAPRRSCRPRSRSSRSPGPRTAAGSSSPTASSPSWPTGRPTGPATAILAEPGRPGRPAPPAGRRARSRSSRARPPAPASRRRPRAGRAAPPPRLGGRVDARLDVRHRLRADRARARRSPRSAG